MLVVTDGDVRHERTDRYGAGMPFDNRVTRLLGVDIPIVQAPMGYVAKPPLVAAVSEAGAMGLVPGSLGHRATREDIRRTRDLTDQAVRRQPARWPSCTTRRSST